VTKQSGKEHLAQCNHGSHRLVTIESQVSQTGSNRFHRCIHQQRCSFVTTGVTVGLVRRVENTYSFSLSTDRKESVTSLGRTGSMPGGGMKLYSVTRSGSGCFVGTRAGASMTSVSRQCVTIGVTRPVSAPGVTQRTRPNASVQSDRLL
jgi:hypothetical protein